jgi:hypothetical protein
LKSLTNPEPQTILKIQAFVCSNPNLAMKRFLPGFFLFIAFWSFLADSGGAVISPVFDTLTPDRKYAGYRLHVADIKVIKSKNDELFLSCNLANTGKFDVAFNKKSPMPYLQLTFDQSLAANNLTHLQDNFRDGLLTQALKINLGQVLRNVNLKIKASSPANSETKSQPVALRDAPPKNEAKPKETPANKKNYSEEVFEKPVFEERGAETILNEKSVCPDLVFDTIILVKNDGKTAVLDYRISNVGKGPAKIYSENGDDKNNLGLRAFISGSTMLSKGALVIGGDFIKSGLEQSGGILQPGRSFKGSITLDIRRKTRYLPVIILSLDAFMSLHECDRANNTKSILVE